MVLGQDSLTFERIRQLYPPANLTVSVPDPSDAAPSSVTPENSIPQGRNHFSPGNRRRFVVRN